MSPQRKKLSMRNKNIAPVSNKLKKNLTGPKKEKFIKIYRVSYKNSCSLFSVGSGPGFLKNNWSWSELVPDFSFFRSWSGSILSEFFPRTRPGPNHSGTDQFWSVDPWYGQLICRNRVIFINIFHRKLRKRNQPAPMSWPKPKHLFLTGKKLLKNEEFNWKRHLKKIEISANCSR